MPRRKNKTLNIPKRTRIIKQLVFCSSFTLYFSLLRGLEEAQNSAQSKFAIPLLKRYAQGSYTNISPETRYKQDIENTI